jgi:glycosyltransferase involved in cell wall biosynthesis
MSAPRPRSPRGHNEAPTGAALARLGRLAAQANGEETVDLPTGVGFCLYLRRECLQATGVFREDVFAQGYGEENDFCRRASHLGWRHVAVPGAYVAHLGGRSFGAAREALIARNLDVLDRLHPGYRAMIHAWMAEDPLLPARRRLDMLRAQAALGRRGAGAVLLVTHDSGGGVERCVRVRCQAVRALGQVPIVLRSVLDRSGGAAALERSYLPGLCEADIDAVRWPNLRFRLPGELDALAALLRGARPVEMEVHHLLGHHRSVLDLARRLGIGYQMRIHDYASFCPRISLLGPAGRYCGEPALSGCEACVADSGSRLEEEISVAALLERSAAELAAASRVVVPSADTGARLRRHFPAVEPVVEPHEPDCYGPLPPAPRHGPRLACVVGAIGPEKGYDVLLACARDARARGLDLQFRVVGHTVDDDRLLATGRVFITGPYKPAQAEALIRAQHASFAFLPSIWPETWCLALGEAMRAGLAVAAFDIGAQAERIRATGRGWLLPLGLSAAGINNTLLALPRLQVMET